MKIALFFREFYPHPVEKVWRAVSTREGLAVWLMDNDFEPQEGKRFALRYPPHAGGRGWINCQVVAIEPPEDGRQEGREEAEKGGGRAAPGHRARATPTRWHGPLTGQTEQWGESGRQTFWPKATRRSL